MGKEPPNVWKFIRSPTSRVDKLEIVIVLFTKSISFASKFVIEGFLIASKLSPPLPWSVKSNLSPSFCFEKVNLYFSSSSVTDFTNSFSSLIIPFGKFPEPSFKKLTCSPTENIWSDIVIVSFSISISDSLNLLEFDPSKYVVITKLKSRKSLVAWYSGPPFR